jgi:hypothetical protein
MPGAIVAATALAILAAIGAGNAKVRQGVHALGGFQVDATAEAAIAAIRAAERHGFLPPETHAAAAAIAGLHFQLGFVDEFHQMLREKPWPSGRGGSSWRARVSRAHFKAKTKRGTGCWPAPLWESPVQASAAARGRAPAAGNDYFETTTLT